MKKLIRNENIVAICLKGIALIVLAFSIIKFIYYSITLPSELISLESVLNFSMNDLKSVAFNALLLLGLGELIEQLYQANKLKKAQLETID